MESQNSMEASRPAAFILPALFDKMSSEMAKENLCEILALSLTHASREVRRYAAEGVGYYLWQIDRDLTLTCVEAIIHEAKLKHQVDLREDAKLYSQQLNQESRREEVVHIVRPIISKRECFDERDLFTLDLNESWVQPVLWQLVPIFGQHPQEELSRRFFRFVAETLVNWWDKDKHAKSDTIDHLDYWLNYFCIQRLSRFVFGLEPSEAKAVCEPIINAVDFYPKEATNFIEWLIISEDTIGNESVFWSLWEIIAERVSKMHWTEHFNREDSDRIKLLNTTFLCHALWKEDIRQIGKG